MTDTNNNLPSVPGDNPPPDVPTSIPDRKVAEPEAIEAMQRAGAVVVQSKLFHDLESVGIHVRGVGVLKYVRGRAVISQHRLDTLMKEIAERILVGQSEDGGKAKKPSNAEIIKMTNALGYLSTKLTESLRLLVEIEGVVAPPGGVREEEQVQASFGAGVPVRPALAGGTTVFAKEVHLHEQKK